jgi:hypothetical protein
MDAKSIVMMANSMVLALALSFCVYVMWLVSKMQADARAAEVASDERMAKMQAASDERMAKMQADARAAQAASDERIAKMQAASNERMDKMQADARAAQAAQAAVFSAKNDELLAQKKWSSDKAQAQAEFEKRIQAVQTESAVLTAKIAELASAKSQEQESLSESSDGNVSMRERFHSFYYLHLIVFSWIIYGRLPFLQWAPGCRRISYSVLEVMSACPIMSLSSLAVSISPPCQTH